MASNKYGVRPPGWAKHRRNLDQPFEPKLRRASKNLIREVEAEEAMKIIHAAKDSEVLATSKGRQRRSLCGPLVPAMRCDLSPYARGPVNCWECLEAQSAQETVRNELGGADS